MDTKKQMFENFQKDLTSDDMAEGSSMYYAMYAFEMHGSATRDNSLEELVSIGKTLESEDST